MGFFGSALGGALGSLGSSFFPVDGIDGHKLGGFLGSLAPFKRGGMVKTKQAKKKASPRNYQRKKNKSHKKK